MLNKKTAGKGSHALAVQAMQQKRCPLSSALSGFCKGGAARQTIPHRSGAPRHEVFPAMVRVRWHRIGINAQMGARPQRCKEVAASKKTGHGIADHRRCWSVLLGMDAQPVALQPEGLRLRVFKEPREGSPMPHLTGFFLTTCTGAPCPTWRGIQGGHDAGRRHPVRRPLAA